MFKSLLRHMEIFVAAFMATSIVGDLLTEGWSGIDMAAAWAAVGALLPWLLGAWFGTWAALTIGERVWSRFRRSAPAGDRGAA